MTVNKFDKLTFSKAEALHSVFLFCIQYDVKLTISSDEVVIMLPCGGEISTVFKSQNNYEKLNLIYKQLINAKVILNDLKLNEDELLKSFINRSV